VAFADCQPDDNTLNGELRYEAALDAAATDTFAGVASTYTYRGLVTSSGETNGSCEIDVEGHVNASAGQGPGDEFKADVEIEYQGTICGHDAHEVLSAHVDASKT
jgi:hypothetical protein